MYLNAIIPPTQHAFIDLNVTFRNTSDSKNTLFVRLGHRNTISDAICSPRELVIFIFPLSNQIIISHRQNNSKYNNIYSQYCNFYLLEYLISRLF